MVNCKNKINSISKQPLRPSTLSHGEPEIDVAPGLKRVCDGEGVRVLGSDRRHEYRTVRRVHCGVRYFRCTSSRGVFETEWSPNDHDVEEDREDVAVGRDLLPFVETTVISGSKGNGVKETEMRRVDFVLCHFCPSNREWRYWMLRE